MTWILGRNLALLLAAATLLAGCGWGSPSGAAAGKGTTRPITRKALSAADEVARTMVSAVAANKPSTVPVQVKFDVRDHPDVGQPVEVDLAIVPMSGSVDRVSGKVEADEGIEVVDGAEIAATDRPAEGTPIRHSVKVLPKREGIFTVRAVVTVDASGQSSTETYAIPLIAAGGTPGQPGKPTTGPAVASAAPAPRG
jgi:hypothetical protein